MAEYVVRFKSDDGMTGDGANVRARGENEAIRKAREQIGESFPVLESVERVEQEDA